MDRPVYVNGEKHVNIYDAAQTCKAKPNEVYHAIVFNELCNGYAVSYESSKPMPERKKGDALMSRVRTNRN